MEVQKQRRQQEVSGFTPTLPDSSSKPHPPTESHPLPAAPNLTHIRVRAARGPEPESDPVSVLLPSNEDTLHNSS